MGIAPTATDTITTLDGQRVRGDVKEVISMSLVDRTKEPPINFIFSVTYADMEGNLHNVIVLSEEARRISTIMEARKVNRLADAHE